MVLSTYDIRSQPLARIFGSIFPLCEAVTDNFHCSHSGVTQTGIARNFPANPFTFATKHLAYGLQFKDDSVDFFHGRAGHAPDESIQIVSDRFRRRIRVWPLATQERYVASDEFANLTLETRRRLVGVAQFLH